MSKKCKLCGSPSSDLGMLETPFCSGGCADAQQIKELKAQVAELKKAYADSQDHVLVHRKESGGFKAQVAWQKECAVEAAKIHIADLKEMQAQVAEWRTIALVMDHALKTSNPRALAEAQEKIVEAKAKEE